MKIDDITEDRIYYYLRMFEAGKCLVFEKVRKANGMYLMCERRVKGQPAGKMELRPANILRPVRARKEPEHV